MIWFTSDTHFGHRNIIGYTDRPFDSIEEMDAALIENWNAVVRPTDEIFHLGDFTFGNADIAQTYFRQLNGRIKVLSNSWHHDKIWLKAGDRAFLNRQNLAVGLLPPMAVLEFPFLGDGEWPQVIALSHYPMAVWDRSHYGAWHLHGHSHCNYQALGKRIYDVGVDCNNYTPVSIYRIQEIMEAM